MLHEIVTLIHLADKSRKITAPHGGHMWNCVACKQAQPHALMTVMRDESAPFAQNQKWGRELWIQSVCEVCKSSTIHPHGINFTIIELWNSHCDLHDFARRSGYGVLPANYRLITTQSAGALIKSITSNSPVLSSLKWTDYLLAVIIFVVVCFLALVNSAEYFHQENLPKWLWISPLGGFLLGFIYLWLVVIFRKAGTLEKRMLEERLTHLGISHEIHSKPRPQRTLEKERGLPTAKSKKTVIPQIPRLPKYPPAPTSSDMATINSNFLKKANS